VTLPTHSMEIVKRSETQLNKIFIKRYRRKDYSNCIVI
jgi:hypothetical protein